MIVQFGGALFFTVALTLDQWLWSILFGIGDMLYAQVTACLLDESGFGFRECIRNARV